MVSCPLSISIRAWRTGGSISGCRARRSSKLIGWPAVWAAACSANKSCRRGSDVGTACAALDMALSEKEMQGSEWQARRRDGADGTDRIIRNRRVGARTYSAHSRFYRQLVFRVRMGAALLRREGKAFRWGEKEKLSAGGAWIAPF